MKRALIIPDCHIPFEDKRAYDLMLEVGRHINPDEIVILGDYADFWAVSKHEKEFDIDTHLSEEIDAVIDRLKQLRKYFPDANIVYIEGNHEFRLHRYIRDNCRDFYGLVDLKGLLQLDLYDIKLIPYSAVQKYNVLGSKLIARHEPIGGGLHCAHSTVSKSQASVIFGHTHRLQESQIVSIHGDNFRGISCGWLGDERSPVMGYVKSHHQWSLGFSVVTLLSSGIWLNQLVHIIDYHCIVDGFVFSN